LIYGHRSLCVQAPDEELTFARTGHRCWLSLSLLLELSHLHHGGIAAVAERCGTGMWLLPARVSGWECQAQTVVGPNAEDGDGGWRAVTRKLRYYLLGCIVKPLHSSPPCCRNHLRHQEHLSVSNITEDSLPDSSRS